MRDMDMNLAAWKIYRDSIGADDPPQSDDKLEEHDYEDDDDFYRRIGNE